MTAWDRLPLLILFVQAWLVHRLVVTCGWPERFLGLALRRSGGSLPALLLVLLCTAALLSTFVPNTVTVLTLLPVVLSLDRQLSPRHPGLTTALTLSLAYGANIGGMGSLVGSPSHLLLLGALELYEVPGREQLSFGSWLLRCSPLVLMLLPVAWGLICLGALPRGARRLRLQLPDAPPPAAGSRIRQRWAGLLFVVFFLGWSAESVLRELLPAWRERAPLAALAFLLLFTGLSFLPLPGLQAGLLRPGDLLRGLPRRGLALLALLLLLGGALKLTGLDQGVASLLAALMGSGAPSWALFLGVVLVVMLLTELMSNSLVCVASFGLVFQLALQHQLQPLTLMLAVALASTCAFMTPVATPANALAFGELRGSSLALMLRTGLALNLAGAALIAGWLLWVEPFALG